MTDQLISNGFNLNLSENIPVPINLSIADAKDPSKRKRNFSKSIKLPGTMDNMTFFSGAFSLNVTDTGITFDATAKAEVLLYKRGILIMPNGVLKLNSITMLNGNVQFFDCQVYSETVDYFLLLDSIKVNELDWSDYSHTLTRANIIASWSTAIGSGYYYPLIERGLGRPGATIFRTTDLVPYVYSREVMVKIFEWLDIPISSAFLNTTRYKSKLFGYGGGDILSLSTAAVNDRKVEIISGEYTVTTTPSIWYSLAGSTFYFFEFNQTNPFLNSSFTHIETQDLLGQWDNGEFTCQFTGDYSINITGALQYQFNYTGTFNWFEGLKIKVYKNGGLINLISAANQQISVDNGILTLNTGLQNTVTLQSGDVISFSIDLGVAYITEDFDGSAFVDVTTSTPFNIDVLSLNTAITDGSNVELNQFLPDMKCSDFLLGEIRHHNLYLSDPEDNGMVTIEPFSVGFYKSTNIFDDWTQLIDYDKEMIIKPAANEFAKLFKFSFKKNGDQEALTYLEKYLNEYGDLDYQQGSYYAKGEQKIELPWSTIIPYEIAPGILVPRFIKIQNGVMKPDKGNPRVMMRNGLKSGNWTFRDATNAANTQELTTYPSVHHFDNWNDPIYDLNFKLVNEVFYIATNVTTVNSFSEYYFFGVNEMTNTAGKIMTAYVKLNPYTIKTIDFSKLKMINGSLFRLNEVFDFDDNIVSTTKCELIKVLDARSPNRKKVNTNNAQTIFGDIASPIGVGEDTGVIIGGGNSSLSNSDLIIG